MLNLAYLVAAVMFIVGLRLLSSPRTAPLGNLIGALGMALGIAATLVAGGVLDFATVVAGLALGSLLGAVLAYTVKMTAMPEMVALLNGFGGAASALVASAELVRLESTTAAGDMTTLVSIALSLLIGWVTFTGSVVAFLRLREWLLGGRPTVFTGQHVLNLLLFSGAVAMGVLLVRTPATGLPFYLLSGGAALLGVLLVIPIGGADMPVVISLLNSYSGMAACATGFVLSNNGLIIAGALVGASGIILTQIMCKAMNRSLTNVLFGGFGQAPATPAAGSPAAASRPVRGGDAEEAAMIFDAARSVVIVPGYGMAVAQAQHAVKELADVLKAMDVDVKYAIHPVAGRMPGHMNVLLAEANVPYEDLWELDAINPLFPETDVALVVGANDVVNPAARNDTASPIYGMPVLEVDKARTVMVCKRSLNPGFAGIDNELYYLDNTMMLFGDAKKTMLALAEALKNR